MTHDGISGLLDREAVRLWQQSLAEQREAVEAAKVTEAQEAFSFFLQVLANAVSGKPPLLEMGYRTWIMASRFAPGVCPHSAYADLLAMRRIAIECNGHLSLAYLRADLARDVFEFVLGPCTTAETIGKRVTILAYGINTSPIVRAALPSMEAIGHWWGLRADNKRSAVSAAARKILREVKDKMERRDPRHRNVISELWYAKKEVTRLRCEQAQMGNHNRQSKALADDDDTDLEARRHAATVRLGIPVRREYAGLTPEQLRARLTALRESAEMRRLAGL